MHKRRGNYDYDYNNRCHNSFELNSQAEVSRPNNGVFVTYDTTGDTITLFPPHSPTQRGKKINRISCDKHFLSNFN